MHEFFSVRDNAKLKYISTEVGISELFPKLQLTDDSVLTVLNSSVFDDPFEVGERECRVIEIRRDGGIEVSQQQNDQRGNQQEKQRDNEQEKQQEKQQEKADTPEHDWQKAENALLFPPWLSWDSFYNGNITDSNRPSLLLTETSRKETDTVLQLLGLVPKAPTIPEKHLRIALFYLSMGRQSTLFEFDERKMRFVKSKSVELFRIEGSGVDTVNGIIDVFITNGSRLRRLKYTSAKIYQLSAHKSAFSENSILIAFADCIDRIISKVERFTESLESSIRMNTITTLDLASKMRQPFNIFTILATILGCADMSKSTTLSQLPKAQSLLEAIYKRALLFESSDPQLFELTKLIFQRTSKPWLKILEVAIGLSTHDLFAFLQDIRDTNNEWFVKGSLENDLVVLKSDKIPKFLDQRQANYILEIINNLIIIFQYGPPNVKLDLASIKKIGLDWVFEGPQLVERDNEMQLYKERLNYFLNTSTRDKKLSGNQAHLNKSPFQMTLNIQKKTEVGNKSKTTEKISKEFGSVLFSDKQLELQFKKINSNYDDLSTPSDIWEKDVINNIVDDDIDKICHEILSMAPHKHAICIPFDVVPHICLDQIIKIQWSLTNKMLAQMFLLPGRFHIMSHAIIIANTFFLGSGNLVLRLQQAIFDETFFNGLKLDNDRAWPPSGSEINRALSTLLEEDVHCLPGVCKEVKEQNFVNFGVNGRGWPETQAVAEKNIENSSSILATDVLCLVYNVEKPLSYILNEKFLKICNQVFKRLIRCMRILHVMKNKLYWEKPFMESRNFVNCYSNYIHNIVLSSCWNRIYKYINELDNGDYQGDGEYQGSLQSLIDVFSETAKQIAKAFFIENEIGNLVDIILDKILHQECDIHNEVMEILGRVEEMTGIAKTFVINLGYQTSMEYDLNDNK